MQTEQMSKRVMFAKKPGSYFLPGLKRVRNNRNMSIRELAERAELGADTIWRVETLQRGAEPKTRRKLIRTLDTSLTELLTPDEKEVDES